MTVLHDLARIDVDVIGRPLRLSPQLWAAGLHIGDRVIVEGENGQTLPGVDVDAHDAPIVRLDADLDDDTRTVVVRRAGGGR